MSHAARQRAAAWWAKRQAEQRAEATPSLKRKKRDPSQQERHQESLEDRQDDLGESPDY